MILATVGGPGRDQLNFASVKAMGRALMVQGIWTRVVQKE